MSSKKEKRTAWLLFAASDSSRKFDRVYTVLTKEQLAIYPSDAKDATAIVGPLKLKDATVQVPDITRVTKRHAIEVIIAPPSSSSSSSSATTAGAGAAGAAGASHVVMAAESKEQQEEWLQLLSVAAVDTSLWPGGIDPHTHHPRPLLASLSSAPLASLFPRLPALKSLPLWQRKSLLLRKLWLCTVTFDGMRAGPGQGGEKEREIKRNTLLETLDYFNDAINGVGLGVASSSSSSSSSSSEAAAINPCAPRHALSDGRLMEDVFSMLRCNLFRALPPPPPPPVGNPDEVEEMPFEEPLWPHLSICYELLLRLVTSDVLDLTMKKKLVDGGFVRQLLALMESEDARERDYLKTTLHRIYSKLTQRRATLRRAICGVFASFTFEPNFLNPKQGWARHSGIAELLEILASVINGFAVPIKDEHKTMLMKALMPLHKAEGEAIGAFFPQLSYCVSLFVSKDHSLSTDVIRALLRYWPIGSTSKQMALLNELEDLLEYAEPEDWLAAGSPLVSAAGFAVPLAHRLAKLIGGYHFQVAERALCLWSNDRFTSMVVDNADIRAVFFPLIFASLWTNQQRHWHELIRNLSLQVLERYANADRKLLEGCKATFAALEAEAEAAAAAAAEAAEAVSSTTAERTPSPRLQPQPQAKEQEEMTAAAAADASSSSQLARLAEVQRQIAEMRAHIAQQAMAMTAAATAVRPGAFAEEGASVSPGGSTDGKAKGDADAADVADDDDDDDGFGPADEAMKALSGGFASSARLSSSPFSSSSASAGNSKSNGRSTMAPSALKKLLGATRPGGLKAGGASLPPTTAGSSTGFLQESVAAGMRAVAVAATAASASNAASPLSPSSPGIPNAGSSTAASLSSTSLSFSGHTTSGTVSHARPPAIKASNGFFLGSSLETAAAGTGSGAGAGAGSSAAGGFGSASDSAVGASRPHTHPHPHPQPHAAFSPPSPRPSIGARKSLGGGATATTAAPGPGGSSPFPLSSSPASSSLPSSAALSRAGHLAFKERMEAQLMISSPAATAAGTDGEGIDGEGGAAFDGYSSEEGGMATGASGAGRRPGALGRVESRGTDLSEE